MFCGVMLFVTSFCDVICVVCTESYFCLRLNPAGGIYYSNQFVIMVLH